jgi:hypothetical protein
MHSVALHVNIILTRIREMQNQKLNLKKFKRLMQFFQMQMKRENMILMGIIDLVVRHSVLVVLKELILV